MEKLKVAIIDYEMGNLFSVQRACEHVGLHPIATSDKANIIECDAVILPGVGAFGDAMRNLKRLDLISILRDFIQSGRPFLGICLGLQLLFTESEEFGNHKGLDIINGRVIRFSDIDKRGQKIKVPHVGWNRILHHTHAAGDLGEGTLLRGIKNGEFMYFVHSYYCMPEDAGPLLSTTIYEDIEFCSGVSKENLSAFQFHPEKSAHEGLKIYHNFFDMINKTKEI